MALRAYLIKKHIVPAQPVSFLIGGDFLLPVNCGSHSDYQNFVVENLRKYSKYGPAPRNPSCMQRSYLLSIDFKVTSVTE